ncbi:hypothetical protein [Nevskia ramosa]|uniref:hypothetical protein n=1 Tax=Nevskia ramosa TaxID=64002 RepID=UPI0023544A4B|nr:hypothetical protein [Nevskia ramosa]
MSRWKLVLALPAAMAANVAWSGDDSWFGDVEQYTRLRDTRIDVAGPEPASFTALGVAPFLTAQSLASSDLSIAAAQVFDDQGHPRGALGIDFAPVSLSESQLDLADYQHNREKRFVSRIQLSMAVSKGESDDDRSTRFAPTVRIVLHEQRDPRVHRGPGSLKDCFERHISPPEQARNQLAELAARLKAVDLLLQDPNTAPAQRQEAQQQHEALQAQWQASQTAYRAALHETVRAGMRACRDDPQVAAYTWNATGHAIGISPTFRTLSDGLGALEPRGFVAFGTTAYGFDALGTHPDYAPSFLGRHAQILGQVLYRHNEPLQDPRQPRTFVDADEVVISARLRGGTAPWNANLEAAVLHDWFKDRDDDSFYKLSAGTDLHLGKGLWMSLSIGRTFWRGAIANQTSGGVTLKKSFLN